jgi:hypothetical protein
MKTIKAYMIAGVAALALSSCNDFLTTVPSDSMSPTTTWKTADDASKFVVGVYDGWEVGSACCTGMLLRLCFQLFLGGIHQV